MFLISGVIVMSFNTGPSYVSIITYYFQKFKALGLQSQDADTLYTFKHFPVDIWSTQKINPLSRVTIIAPRNGEINSSFPEKKNVK